MAISQAAAKIPNVIAETPEFDHGETEPSPIPLPKASKASIVAAATADPAKTAAHDTAETGASGAGEPRTPGAGKLAVFVMVFSAFDI